MRIPKKVNIMGHYYKVTLVHPSKMRGASNGEIQVLSNGAAGECEFPTRIIRLNREVSGPLRYLTFLHEVKHGWQFENGWPQIIGSQVMELQCESFVSLVMSLKKQKVL